jgi:hypothetical protein
LERDPPERILLRAASALGSTRILARRLGVTPGLLRSYMQGRQVPPEDLVSAALKVLAHHSYEEIPSQDSDSRR